VSKSDSDGHLIHVAKQATGVMTYQFIGLALGFGSNLIFARVLGAELLGVFVLAQTTLLVLSLAASFGVGPMLLRFMPVALSHGDREGAAAVFAVGARIVLITSAITIAITLLGRNVLADRIFHEPRLLDLTPIIAIAVLPAAFIKLLGFALRAIKQTARETFCVEIVAKSVKLLVFLILLSAGLRLTGLAWALAASYAAATTVMAFIIDRHARYLTRGPRVTTVSTRQIFTFSVAMTFVAFMNYSLSITDRMMLGILSTSEDVGIYNIAFLISNMLSLVFMGFNNAFSPLISELHHNDRKEELHDLYSSLTRTVLIIVLPALIWIVGFGDDLLLFFGRDFRAGYLAMVILGVGVLTRCAVGSVGTLLMLSGHQVYNAVNIAAVTAGNIALNLFLIPRYGVLGAAIATAISLAVINVVGLIEVRLLIGIWPYRLSYLKLVAATAVTLGGNLYLRAHTPELPLVPAVLLLVATSVVFLGVLALMGIEEDDRILIGRMMGRIRQRKRG
jgi:O-antigen/teichoic acid export membrane protein